METNTEEVREGREYLSPDQTAELLGLGRTTTYQLLRDGEVPSFKYGRRRIVARRDIEAWLERHRVDSSEQE
jgi:excisionase family DNA binding protein